MPPSMFLVVKLIIYILSYYNFTSYLTGNPPSPTLSDSLDDNDEPMPMPEDLSTNAGSQHNAKNEKALGKIYNITLI